MTPTPAMRPTDELVAQNAAYLAHLAATGLSAGRQRQAVRDLQQLSTVAAALQLACWQALTPPLVPAFLHYWQTHGLASSRQQALLATLRRLCDWQMLSGQRPANPLRGLAPIKHVPEKSAALASSAVSQLLERRASSGGVDLRGDRLLARDRAMFELIYATGLRVTELIALDVADVNLTERWLQIGGRRARALPLGRLAQESLKQWLTWRQGWAPAHEPALFLSQQRKRISAYGVQLRLDAWGKNQAMAVAVTPSVLRRSAAEHMRAAGTDLAALQAQLGLGTLATAAQYGAPAWEQINQSYALHPRAKRRAAAPLDVAAMPADKRQSPEPEIAETLEPVAALVPQPLAAEPAPDQAAPAQDPRQAD
ncbi:MAG: site-specific integrase [Aeromonas sp.]